MLPFERPQFQAVHPVMVGRSDPTIGGHEPMPVRVAPIAQVCSVRGLRRYASPGAQIGGVGARSPRAFSITQRDVMLLVSDRQRVWGVRRARFNIDS
jgi:hypothetical protein